ncbi:uncharacterized protein KGF55_001067 [Candida pseudojiufengensis]|uniref:uncharacterized protein n=1 Tax=Candida pseudojiufengensis TaxID=497109 RepID=UPI0022257271|nr:uncharacterized protein KGF55_001067 [Candida pseudojiufengensis]KAI5965705.1 hypothetical protein KGF55_001067 [Candida pseudojiufengensis]
MKENMYHHHLLQISRSIKSALEDFGELENNISLPIEETWYLQAAVQKMLQPPSSEELNRLFHSSKKIDEFLKKLMEDYQSNISNNPPPINLDSKFNHKIVLEDPNRVTSLKAFRTPINLKEELDKQVDTLSKAGYIKPSVSEFSSHSFFVNKQDKSKRLVIDFSDLNSNTVAEASPMPLVEDLVESVGSAGFISKLDLVDGYHQIPMSSDSVKFTSFSTTYGQYEWLVMPFGLRNAPATFQRIMNMIFHDFIGRFVVVYLDDILIYSKSEQEHMEHLTLVFQKLHEHNLVAKQKKSEFFKKSTTFLGFKISSNGIATADDKIKAVMEWELPTTPRKFQSLFGFMSNYRRFIKNFSAKARPLILAGLKQIRANSPEVKEAFEQLKLDLKSSLVLKPPEINGTYMITTDASDYALGAVIEILDKKTSKIKGTVAFYSKALDKHQRNYSIREKELLAIIQTLTRFRHFLLGSTFVIKTDHKLLQYLLNNKEPPSSRLSRWLDVLSEFDITIDYIKGNTNIADALSRKFTELVKSDTDYDADDLEGLTIANTTTFHIETHPLGEDILEEIKEGYSQDEQAHEIYHYLSNQLDPPNSIKYRIKKFNYRNGILYFKGFDYRADPIE